MAQPKRKTSKSKIRSRIRSHKRKYPRVHECNECGMPSLPHRVCPSCGMYNGKQVLSMTGDE